MNVRARLERLEREARHVAADNEKLELRRAFDEYADAFGNIPTVSEFVQMMNADGASMADMNVGDCASIMRARSARQRAANA